MTSVAGQTIRQDDGQPPIVSYSLSHSVEDPVVTRVGGCTLVIPTATPSHQLQTPTLLPQTKHRNSNSSEDKLKCLERQIKSVPHPATNKPNDEEFFYYDRDGGWVPNREFIREHFFAEGRLTEQQAIYILDRVTDILSREPNLLFVPSPVTGGSPYTAGVHDTVLQYVTSVCSNIRGQYVGTKYL